MNTEEIIKQIAKEAGDILLKYYKQGVSREEKDGDEHDLVTIADLESQKYIIGRLREEFPEDQILAEEEDRKELDFSGRVWMIDPLDGTKYFINGDDEFAVLIGLCVNGTPELGVVYAPALDVMYFACKNKGAFVVRDGIESSLNVSDTSTLVESVLVTRAFHGEKRKLDEFIDSLNVKGQRPEGLKIMKVAEGDVDAYIHTNPRAGKWDTCAQQVILEEAGGIITDFNGSALDYKQESRKWKNLFVASNGVMHDQIIVQTKKVI